MFLPVTFHDAISVAVPQIIGLLKDNNSDVWSCGADAIGELAKHSMCEGYTDDEATTRK